MGPMSQVIVITEYICRNVHMCKSVLHEEIQPLVASEMQV